MQALLADLPDDVLTVLLGPLTTAELRQLSTVCRGWDLTSSRVHLWYGLAAARGVEMPRTGVRFSLRSKADLRSTFFAACKAQRAAHLQLFDRRAMALIQMMSSRDGAAVLRREMAREPMLPADHILDPAARGGHATLLHAAARYGRVACGTHLLDEAGQDIEPVRRCGTTSTCTCPLLEVKDAGGATPLLIAAWCGHLKMVKLLISRGASTRDVGIPPMTSACGGKGPYDAETWAGRKGFHAVAREIRASNDARAVRVAHESE